MALTYGPLPLRLLVRAYSDIIRGIPVLILIFAVYYGLPALQVNLSNLAAAVAALTMFTTAQVIETTRGAIQSIHHGQMEAAKAIGLGFGSGSSTSSSRRRLPASCRPGSTASPTRSRAVLVSLVGVVDLMLAIQRVIGRVYEPMPLYLLGAAIYFAINYSLSSLSRRLEQRFAYVRE